MLLRNGPSLTEAMWRPGIDFDVGLVTVVFVLFCCLFLLQNRSRFQDVGFAILPFVKARRLVACPGRLLVTLARPDRLDQRVDSQVPFPHLSLLFLLVFGHVEYIVLG